MIVFLDRQHVGKPTNMDDLGAWGDLDVDSKVAASGLEMEANLTLLYGHLHAAVALRAAGLDVVPLSHGRYKDRHAFATDMARRAGGRHVYVALHLNSAATQADYGSVFYDHRSPASDGPELARLVAGRLRQQAPELGDVKAIAARPTDWTRRAYSTIEGTGPGLVSLCYEPAFLSTPKHRPLFGVEGLRRLGVALAEGIVDYHRALHPIT